MEQLAKFLSTLSLLCIACLHLQAQQCGQYSWASEGTGPERDEGHGIAVDPFGNVFLGGWFDSDSIRFAGGAASNSMLGQTGNGDVFIARYKANGSLSWVVSAGGFDNSDWCWDIAAGPDGSVFGAGQFYSSVMDFGGGVTISKNGLSDAWIAKWDSTGVVQWARAFGAGDSDQGLAVAVDNVGNSYLTGDFGDSITHGVSTIVENAGDDLFVAVYDPSGNPLWAVSAGGPSYEGGQDIAVADDGRIYVAGRTFGDMDFAGNSLTNAGLGDLFLLSFTPTGAEDWMFSAGGVDGDEARGVSVHPDGSVVLVGSYWSSPLNFGGINLTSSGQWDSFIARFEANGNLLWVRGDGGSGTDHLHSVAVGPQGTIYSGGQWGNGSASLDAFALTGPGVFTAVWDEQGNALKATVFTGILTQFDAIWATAAGPNGGGYYGGEFTSASIDFGGGTIINNGPSGVFDSDVFALSQSPFVLQAPVNLNHVFTSPTNLDLNWDPVYGASKYRIKIKRVVQGPKKKKLFVSVSTNLSFSGLLFPPGDHYQWAVKAACNTDTSDWSLPGDIFIPLEKNAISNELSLFPNPSTGSFHLLSNRNGEYEFSVYNLLGQHFVQSKGVAEDNFLMEVETLYWPNGIYIYKLTIGGTNYSGLLEVE